MPKIDYEKHIVGLMIELYCHRKHETKKKELCADCASLKEFCYVKLDKCPFGDDKGACSDCEIHCYKNTVQREKIREVMRFSGPRMMLYYPWDSLLHIVKRKRK